MTMDAFKRACAPDLGIGGMKCPHGCCAPKPGKARKEMRRAARRRLHNRDRVEFRGEPARD